MHADNLRNDRLKRAREFKSQKHYESEINASQEEAIVFIREMRNKITLDDGWSEVELACKSQNDSNPPKKIRQKNISFLFGRFTKQTYHHRQNDPNTLLSRSKDPNTLLSRSKTIKLRRNHPNKL